MAALSGRGQERAGLLSGGGEVPVVGVQVPAGCLHRGMPDDLLQDMERDSGVGHPGSSGVTQAVAGQVGQYMPTNILLDAIRSRRGLRWGIPAMLLAAPYLLVASICTSLIADGGPGWLNLLVLLFIWNALKFICIGPVSLLLLARARYAERGVRGQRYRQQTGAAL